MRKIDEALARQLAVRASVDPRSILKAAAGLPVRGLAGYRARAILRAEGLLPPPSALASVSSAENGGNP